MTVVVITGVSRGLGHAMAHGFAAAGCTVYGCSRSATAVDALNAKLRAPHDFSVVDVSSDDEVRSWAGQILQQGAIDFLVNNAALINVSAPLWNVSAEEFDRLTAVNINGTANTIRHLVPSMVKRSQGIIVNFSSGWGRSTSPEVAPYCGTKWAIEGLTRALASELPGGMAAIPLNPGIINTEMLQSCFGGGADMYPSPKDWAAVAVPFILGLSADVNGKSLTVPGM